MDIPVKKNINQTFSLPAREELKKQTIDFANKVIDEAERIEAVRSKSFKIEVTANSVKKASEFVIEYRVENQQKNHSVGYICSALQAAMGIGLTIALSFDLKEAKPYVVIGSIMVFSVSFIFQVLYNKNQK